MFEIFNEKNENDDFIEDNISQSSTGDIDPMSYYYSSFQNYNNLLYNDSEKFKFYNNDYIFNIKDENKDKNNSIRDRKDYILKAFKVKSSQYLIKLLNCNPYKIKFYKLNFKYFTRNINYNDNHKWFNENISEIIKYKNSKNEKAILKFEKIQKKSKNENNEKLKKINSLLYLTYREFLNLYYKNQFENDFKKNEKYFEVLKNNKYMEIMTTLGNKKKN